jgi:hypothetical protein
MTPASKPFLSPAGLRIDGLRFRPISLGDAEIAKELGITLLGATAEEVPSPAPIQLQITRLLWLLHVPDGLDDDDAAIDARLEAVADGTWLKDSKRFAFRLSATALEKLTTALNGESLEIEAAAVQVAAEENSTGEDGKKKVPSQAESPVLSGHSPVED